MPTTADLAAQLGDLALNARVQIHDLAHRPDLNGRTADIVAMDVNGRFQIQLADGELISVKPCKLKPLPLPKQQAARAINWAEYSQLESRVRSLECADSTHSTAATLALGAKKEHRSAYSKHAACTRASTAAKENIEACETSWFWGTTLWQPQTWASGGVEGSIERSKKILEECDTNEPILRARARATQERMTTAAGEERRAAHAVSSKQSFSAQMATMKKQAIDANPSQHLRELLTQEARAVEQVRQRSAMGEDAKALVTATSKGVSYLQKALGCCHEAKVLHERAARVVIPAKPSAWAGDWAQAATPATPRPNPADVSRIDVDGCSIHAANPLHGWAHASGMVSGGVLTMDFGGVPISGRLSNSGATIEWSNRTKWRKAHKHKLSLLKGRDESLRSAQDYLYQGSEYLQRRCSAALHREYPQLAGTVDQPIASAARLSQTHAAPQLALGASSGLGGLLCLVGDAVIASGDLEKIEKNAAAVRHAEGQAQCRMNVAHMLEGKALVHLQAANKAVVDARGAISGEKEHIFTTLRSEAAAPTPTRTPIPALAPAPAPAPAPGTGDSVPVGIPVVGTPVDSDFVDGDFVVVEGVAVAIN